MAFFLVAVTCRPNYFILSSTDVASHTTCRTINYAVSTLLLWKACVTSKMCTRFANGHSDVLQLFYSHSFLDSYLTRDGNIGVKT